jgi:hypothetical protein
MTSPRPTRTRRACGATPTRPSSHVLDQAQLSVPDDPAYAFVGADPGTTVGVVPQTQNPEVVWLGWNTL